MSGSFSCVRKTFCWFNILISICGCTFLGAGIWLRLAYQGYATLLPNHAGLSADSLFIGVGVLSFVLTFFGCCGSWIKSRCLLITYFTLIVLLFLSELIIGSLSFLFRGGISKVIIYELKHGIQKHYNATDMGGKIAPSVASIWDKLQKNFRCCGVESYKDWYNISSWPNEEWVPRSCCRPLLNQTLYNEFEGSGEAFSSPKFLTDCTRSNDPQLWWDHGCGEAFQFWIFQRLHIVGTVALVVGFLQLFGLITSLLLFCTMKNKTDSETYKSYSTETDINQRQ